MVTSNVTRFSQPGTVFAGQTFTILPQGEQVGSLEFQRYAEMVANQLAVHGMIPVPASQQADTLVFLDYGVDEGRTILRSRPVYGSLGFGYGHFGGWRRGTALGLGFPLYPDYGYWGNEVYSTTRYTRWLQTDIIDADAYRRGVPERVFEGRAISEGTTRSLPDIMPYLVTALFEDFPGGSGRTVRVAVPVPGT